MKIIELAQLLTPLVSIGAIVWQIAEMKTAIYKYIDSEMAIRDAKLNQLEINIAVTKSSSEDRKEFVDYQLHGIREAVAHKFKRCMDEIKEVTEKQN
jgi:hypothetical protein